MLHVLLIIYYSMFFDEANMVNFGIFIASFSAASGFESLKSIELVHVDLF